MGFRVRKPMRSRKIARSVVVGRGASRHPLLVCWSRGRGREEDALLGLRSCQLIAVLGLQRTIRERITPCAQDDSSWSEWTPNMYFPQLSTDVEY
jgi:hypothetical protein